MVGAEGHYSNRSLALDKGEFEDLQVSLLDPGVRSEIRDLHDSLQNLPQSTPLPRLSDKACEESTLLKKRPTRLSPKQIEQLLEGYQAGEKINDLASVFEIHPSTVSALAKEHGFTGKRYPKLTADQIQQAKRLYAGGESTLVIANLFGVASDTVALALRNAGVPLRRRNGW
jgi:hypothetical protein